MKKKRLFMKTPSSDGVDWYCGDESDMDGVLNGIRNLLCVEDVYAIMGIENPDINDDYTEITFSVKEMTDEEIESLPDC